MHQAASAYNQVNKSAQDPRDLEADILIRAAAMLQSSYDNWDDGTVRDALIFNRRLWTILVTSATDPENPLPTPIKQNIGNIGVFIFNRSVELMAEPEREKLRSLVNINREIAAGLRGRP